MGVTGRESVGEFDTFESSLDTLVFTECDTLDNLVFFGLNIESPVLKQKSRNNLV